MVQNVVTLALAAAVILVGQTASAFESHLKMRFHRELISNVFSTNFGLLIQRVEKEQEKDVKLEDIGATMSGVHIGIRPISGKSWEDMTPFETFFDDGQIIFEGHDFEFQGTG
jgi:hypothetical protein